MKLILLLLTIWVIMDISHGNSTKAKEPKLPPLQPEVEEWCATSIDIIIQRRTIELLGERLQGDVTEESQHRFFKSLKASESIPLCNKILELAISGVTLKLTDLAPYFNYMEEKIKAVAAGIDLGVLQEGIAPKNNINVGVTVEQSIL